MGEKSPPKLTKAIRTVKKRYLIHKNRSTAYDRALFIFLLLLGLAFLFYSDFGRSPNRHTQRKEKLSSSSFLPLSKNAERYMDRQLQDTAKKTELNALRTKLENKKWAPPLSKGQMRILQNHQNNIYQGFTRETPESHAAQVYDDISRADVYEHKGSPEARIEALIDRRKFIEEYSRDQKVEYVRQFLKNAEEQGYIVQLNDNLEVVRVRQVPTDRPLRLPQAEGNSYQNNRSSPFDSGYSGSR